MQAEKCWNDDRRIPLFKKRRPERYTVDHAIQIITKYSDTYAKCSRQPLKVRENASFLIDVKWFKNWEDLKADMNGVYDSVLRCAVSTIEMDDSSWTLLQKKKAPLTSRNTYHLIQNSRRNKAAPSLVRSLFLMKDVKGNTVENICLLQYHVSNEKHGNSSFTNPKPFYLVKKKHAHRNER